MALTGSGRREVYRVYSHAAFLADGTVAEPLERTAARGEGPLRLVIGAALPLGLVAAATVAIALESPRHGALVAQGRRVRALPARERIRARVERRRRLHQAPSAAAALRAVARLRGGGARSRWRAHRGVAAATRAASPATLAYRSTSRPSPPPASESQGPEFLFER